MSAIGLTEHDRMNYRSQLAKLVNRVARETVELKQEGTQPEEMAAIGTDAVPQQTDRAAREAEEEVARAILASEVQILVEARAALDRLDAGTFGTCERCKKPIPRVRLEAVPYARWCISCAANTTNGAAD
jgi:RNA polymerase-binding transcription factor DksA